LFLYARKEGSERREERSEGPRAGASSPPSDVLQAVMGSRTPVHGQRRSAHECRAEQAFEGGVRGESEKNYEAGARGKNGQNTKRVMMPSNREKKGQKGQKGSKGEGGSRGVRAG